MSIWPHDSYTIQSNSLHHILHFRFKKANMYSFMITVSWTFYLIINPTCIWAKNLDCTSVTLLRLHLSAVPWQTPLLGCERQPADPCPPSNRRPEWSRKHKSCIFAGRLIQRGASHRTESMDTQRGVWRCLINYNAGSSALLNADTCSNLIGKTKRCLQCHWNISI